MRTAGGRTLTLRLTVLLVVVLLVATGVAATATALTFRSFLLGRLDDQLAGAGSRYAASVAARGDAGDTDDVVPGQAVGTLAVGLTSGRATEAAVVGPGGRTAPVQLTATDVAALARLPRDGAPRTVDLQRLHDYRVQATVGPQGTVLVSGLPEAEVDAAMRRLVGTESALFLVVVGAAGVVVAALVRRTLRPLHTVAETARRVAGLPLTAAGTPLPTVPTPDRPASEVGQVSGAVQQMVEHVRVALAARDATERRLRRFVADASHELRTPLASVRAHSDLVQRGTEPPPPAVAHALTRIDAATDRMTALVDDLLLLARLDSDADLAGDGRTDLSRLVVETVVDARTLAPDHLWRLVLPDAAVVVPGDTDRWRRVVGNLVANARVHTPPGTRVTVTLTAADPVELVVADDGPGVPAAVHDTVFDRFARGDASRAATSGGSGLGLAIAHAVVTAVGGTLTLDPADDAGSTTFRVRVPRPAATTASEAREPLEAL